ncbi:MAG: electron transfer flavoprotein subunit beta/FixA family protein [Candidatus Thermoplasmatota archaeon]
MKYVVCVKQVPDTTEVKIDPKTNTLIREGVPAILNPFDQFALEECVRIRDITGGEITVISMGPEQARSALMRCLALGGDKAILISDRAFAGSDTYATSYVLSLAIKKLGKFDLVFCGQQAIDGDTAQVGPELAQNLGIPQITYVEAIEKIEDKKVVAKAQTDDGYIIIEAKLPALVTCTPPTSFEPKSPMMSGIMKAKKKELILWDTKIIGSEADKYGLSGSPTQVIKVYPPPIKGKGLILEGEPKECVEKIVSILKEHII